MSYAPMELLGRDTELAQTLEALAQDRAVVVLGEAGIGKTSLLRAAVARTGRTVREGGAFATLSWMSYLPLERAIGGRLTGDAAWIAGLVERAVGPDVLLVDDLQWADSGTLDVLGRLIGRIALVAGIRRGEAASTDIVDTYRAAGARVVEVGPLPPTAATELARRGRPELGVARASAVAARAGGNPFIIEQLAAASEPTAGLRRAIAARLDGLAPEAWTSLVDLALADRPVAAASLPGAEALRRDGLAIADPDGLTVRHALLADAIRERATPDEAQAAHRRLAGVIDDPGERARHLAAAGDAAAAHDLAMRAAAAAPTPGERAAHLGLAAATATGPTANALRIEAATALRVAGDLDGAARLLDALEEPDGTTLAHALAVRARLAWSAGDPDAMRAAIDRGLEIGEAAGTSAEALLRAERLTLTGLVDGRFEEALLDADAALELAREAGADPTRALLLRATFLTALGRGSWAEALDAVVTAARDRGDHETELSAANNLVAGHEMYGRPADGRAIAAAMAERAHDLRLAGWHRQFEAMLANLDLHAGDLRGALARAEALLEEALDPLATQQVGLIAGLALVDLGRYEEAGVLLQRLLASAAPDVTGRGDVLFVLAEAALWGGRPGEALAQLDGYRAYATSEYPTSFLVDVTAAWAAVEAQRPLPERLARGDPSGMLAGAAVERTAVEALAAGRDEEAAGSFEAAAIAYAGFHARGMLRSRWASAEATRRAGRLAEAQGILEGLEAEVEGPGFAPLLGRVHRSLRLLGVRRTTRRPSLDPAARLTAREKDVAELVGRGLTNVEIARRMGLGRPTVARLVSNAMGKVGVDSRVQLVARLEERV